MPFVHYPGHYGAFFAFSEAEDKELYFCACAEQALNNLLELRKTEKMQYSDPLRSAPLSSHYVPSRIAEASLRCPARPCDAISFRPRLCHRCHLVSPALRWCHEMYGGRFKQHYGWYIEQAYLRLGIERHFGPSFLSLVCPPEDQTRISELVAAREAYSAENARLQSLAAAPPRTDIAPDEITYWSNVRIEEAQEMIRRRKLFHDRERALANRVEDVVREESGHRRIGDGWVSETLLAQIVTRLFQPNAVVRHARPQWLRGLELDLYIPARNVAIEYQGQQHFHPVKCWGGERGLAQVRRRDLLKARLCAQQSVRLTTFDYTEPLTEQHVGDVLKGYC